MDSYFALVFSPCPPCLRGESALDFQSRNYKPALPRQLRKPGLANHGHLDLAGIGELLLKRLGNVAAKLGGGGVVRLAGAGDDAQFAASLNSKRLLDAAERFGDGFQLFTSGPTSLANSFMLCSTWSYGMLW